MDYYETLFLLHTHWNFSWDELNHMYPFEYDFIITQIMLEKNKKNKNIGMIEKLEGDEDIEKYM